MTEDHRDSEGYKAAEERALERRREQKRRSAAKHAKAQKHSGRTRFSRWIPHALVDEVNKRIDELEARAEAAEAEACTDPKMKALLVKKLSELPAKQRRFRSAAMSMGAKQLLKEDIELTQKEIEKLKRGGKVLSNAELDKVAERTRQDYLSGRARPRY